MEYATINKETPEMKQLISGIRNEQMPSGDCQNASFTIQRKNLPHEARGLSANTFSSALVPCRIIGTRALFPTPKSQGRYSTNSPTLIDYCKRIIEDKAFTRDVFLSV